MSNGTMSTLVIIDMGQIINTISNDHNNHNNNIIILCTPMYQEPKHQWQILVPNRHMHFQPWLNDRTYCAG